jgi:hypothetical protein
MLLELKLLQYQADLSLRKNAENTWVFDPIRKKDIVLTPEELMRQLLLQYLLQNKGYPANKIRVEVGIELNGLSKRCDILVYDAAFAPWLLIECKSPKVSLKTDTFEQAARYNLRLRAPYLAISNGLSSYCCRLDLENESFEYLNDFPSWA